MRPISTTELAQLLGGRLDSPREAQVYGFATDHRHAKPGDAFLAIKGAKFDGHEFVPQAIKAGAVVVIVEREVSAPHITVDNLVDSLARLGSTMRDRFEGPVIGITGSAGKTTTKEFLASALTPLGRVLKTEGNRNTEYTAPLMWAELEPDTAAVVVEMAMRGFNQISHLTSFARPTVGIVTNIGYGHMEMVESRAGIARAKGELIEALPEDGTAIFWAEDDYLSTLRATAGSRRVLTFGFSEEADCRITSYRSLNWHRGIVEGELGGVAWQAHLPIIGRHIALNAAAAVLAAWVVGVPPSEAAAQIEHAKVPPMRMEVRELNGATVLLDNYNASPPAMLAALETLSELHVSGRRFAVLGEMKELGEHREGLHREVGRAIARAGLDRVLLFGEPMVTWAREEAGIGETANSIDDVREFLEHLKPGDVCLIKGSRALELERALPTEETA